MNANDGFIVPADENWADNYQEDDTEVVAHTPDETAYHAPNSGALRQAGISMAGRTMLPRANDDGTSKGFDHNSAGVVHVDPSAKDGGAILDLTNVDEKSMKAAAMGSKSASHAFYRLSQIERQRKANDAKVQQHQARQRNPKMNGYVVPKTNPDGSVTTTQSGDQYLGAQTSDRITTEQYMSQVSQPMPLDGAPEPQPTPQPAPESAPAPQPHHTQQPQNHQQYHPPQGYAEPARPAPQYNQQPNYDQQFGALQHQLGHLASLMQQSIELQMHQMSPNPAPEPDFTEPVEPQKPEMQSVAEMQADEKNNMLIAGFETLQMAYVEGPVATKPQKRVIFDMGMHGGTMQARYHDVVIAGGQVVLVYDTRFEDGFQFAPPDQTQISDASITLRLPDAEQQEITVKSMGIQFTIGVLDVIVLLKLDQ